MCTSPIYIRNPKFRNSLDTTLRAYIQVPCGSCDECLRRRASDLFIRTQYEYKKALRDGGCAFMCCLTYGLDLCPTLTFEGKKYKVFNKKDVIDFIKRIRINLERYFKKEFHCHAPVFKYVVTSEFGKSAEGFHLPHYHIIFIFDMPITLRAFRINFVKSMVNHKTGKRYFGKIYQCDLLDPSRGGIRYSCKYILKDLMFANTRKIINDLIKSKQDEINQRFGIILFPTDWIQEMHNKCVRQNSRYREAVQNNVLPYRHKLQFFMCSNDLGVSAIIDRYGKSVCEMPVLTSNGFTYALPKVIKNRVEKDFGSRSSARLAQNIFLSSFNVAADTLFNEGKLSLSDISLLNDFINNYTQFEGGFLFIVHPNGVRERLYDNIEFPDYDEVLAESSFNEDNDFYSLREAVLSVISSFNSKKRLSVRAKVAHDKVEKENFQYNQKKKNNGYK